MLAKAFQEGSLAWTGTDGNADRPGELWHSSSKDKQSIGHAGVAVQGQRKAKHGTNLGASIKAKALLPPPGP